MAMDHSPSHLFQHVQSEASASWVIVHNLQMYPIIDVYVTSLGELQKILPSEVVYTDLNTVTVNFTTANSGTATVA